VTDGPRKPRSPARFVAVGCAVSLAIGTTIAILAGIAIYRVTKEIEAIAYGAGVWLAAQPAIQEELGPIQRAEPLPGSRSLDVKQGTGWFDFQVQGSKASGRARVSVARREGEWRAVGARLTVGDRETTFGTPP
jgi:hypothetical protein